MCFRHNPGNINISIVTIPLKSRPQFQSWPKPTLAVIAVFRSILGEDAGLKLLAILASFYWAWFFLFHKVFGPLNIDELYFAHIMWMVRQGLRPYSEFYSLHLPYYFEFLDAFLPFSRPTDLGFVYWMRLLAIVVATLYVVMLSGIARRRTFLLLPFLLSFLVVGRATEVRADTVGLLLFNAGWWVLIVGKFRAKTVVAAVIAAFALLFSARAAVMAPAIAIACMILAVRTRDGRLVISNLAVGGVFLGLVSALYLHDPQHFLAMVKSVFIDTSQLQPKVDLLARLGEPQRAFLLVLIISALVSAILAFRHDRKSDVALVVMIACAVQVVVIFADPSPFHYVYSWALIPTLAGLTIGFEQFGKRATVPLTIGLAGISFAMLSMSIAYLVIKRHSPPTNSVLRLTFDAPLPTAKIKSMSTAELLAWSISGEAQQGLWNQLAVKSEICERVKGKALAAFQASPICLHDAQFDWIGLSWPDLYEGRVRRGDRRAFEQLLATSPPALVAWGSQYQTPPLTPWGKQLLTGYQIGDGYALQLPVERPSRTMQAEAAASVDP